MNQLKIRYWTREPKLVCHKCGRYYARTFNNNKEIWKSLCTAHFSVAKVRLAEFQRIKTVGRVVGLYGVIAYSVSQRTREIGIRIALGAQQNNVMRLILGEGMLVILIGLAIGLAGSVALTRFLSSLLFGVTATDPITFGAVAILLAVVAVAACYIPARRAMRVNPIVALKI